MRKLFIILLFFIPVIIVAQNNSLRFRHIGHNEGLSGYRINHIFQDTYGYIWIATNNGIDRYDGYNYSNYISFFKKELGYNKSIVIKCITQNKKGQLFFGSNIGIIIYDVIYQKVTLINSSIGNIQLSNNGVFSIYIDNDGIIWAGTWDGLDKINLKANKCIHYKIDTDNRHAYNAVNKVAEDNSENLWLATRDGGIARFNKKTEDLTNFRHIKGDPNSLPCNYIKDIFIDNDNDIWIATWGGGLCGYNKQKQNFQTFNHNVKISENYSFIEINAITQDSKGLLWLATENGLEQFNKQTGKFIHTYHSACNVTGLNSNVLISIYADSQEGIWIGTVSSGINYYNPSINKFNIIDLPDVANTICEDKFHNYWFGTNSGIYILNNDGKNISRQYSDVIKQNVKNVTIIKKDRSQNIWVASDTHLYQFSTTGQFIKKVNYNHFFHDQKELWRITSIQPDENGNLWIGTDNGLLYYDKTDNELRIFSKTNSTIMDNRIGSVLMDSKKNLWIKVAHDLYFKPYKENEFLIFTPENINDKLLSTEISCLYEDSNKNIWIGTDDHYLQKYNYETGRLTTLNNGIISNVKGVTEDHKGDLWFTTRYSLFYYNKQDSSLKEFTTTDGIPGKRMISNATIKTTNNKLIFSTEKGCFFVNPDSIPTNIHLPEITIAGIWINNHRISPQNSPALIDKDVDFINALTLNHKQSNITIDFSALCFVNPDKNHYKYMLSGLHENWVNLGSDHKIYFSNLSPGKYDLDIICSNNDGIWNMQGKKLSIIINPPWWKALWFRILIAALLVALVLIFFKFRLSSLKKQNILLDKIVKERTKEISDKNEELRSQADNLTKTNKILKNLNDTKNKLFSVIAHDLKNPFHAISDMSGTILKDATGLTEKNHLQDIRMIKNSSDQASNLLKNLLQWASIHTEKIDYRPVSIKASGIIEDCINIYKANAKGKNISIICEKNNDPYIYVDKNTVTTIIRNLINNAIKFTQDGGNIKINIQQQRAKVTISISDTGVGMDKNISNKLFSIGKNISKPGTKNEKGTGLGLILCKEFAEKNNGKISFTSKPGIGSTFFLQLPVVKPGSIMEQQEKAAVHNIQTEYSSSVLTETSEDNKNINNQLILIIDDNDEIRHSISQNIKDHYKLLKAADGKQGIELAIKAIPDLIISDIMMPEMDGYQVCDILKNDTLTSHIPIILLTAVEGDDSKIHGYKTGADDYINKPFTPEVLLARINNLLEQRKKLQERYLKESNYNERIVAETAYDQNFLQRAFDILEKNIMNEKFGNEDFVKQMNMSRTQLYRKLMALTNQSVSEFIRIFRLKKAASYLENSNKNINEIVYAVGFRDPSYFSKIFKNYYGVLPSDFPLKK